jgi:hypothetical protein
MSFNARVVTASQFDIWPEEIKAEYPRGTSGPLPAAIVGYNMEKRLSGDIRFKKAHALSLTRKTNRTRSANSDYNNSNESLQQQMDWLNGKVCGEIASADVMFNLFETQTTIDFEDYGVGGDDNGDAEIAKYPGVRFSIKATEKRLVDGEYKTNPVRFLLELNEIKRRIKNNTMPHVLIGTRWRKLKRNENIRIIEWFGFHMMQDVFEKICLDKSMLQDQFVLSEYAREHGMKIIPRTPWPPGTPKPKPFWKNDNLAIPLHSFLHPELLDQAVLQINSASPYSEVYAGQI